MNKSLPENGSTGLSETRPAIDPKEKLGFLRYMHNFRGLAILIIVASHSLPSSSLFEKFPYIQKFCDVFLLNGSVFFIFIAGFLFQFLSTKYVYQQYLSKKLRYVILPYIVMSIPAIWACFNGASGIPTDSFKAAFSGWPIPLQVIMLFLTGAHLPTFWFIPMISLFYLISPILIWMDRHSKVYWILPTLIVISLFVHRPLHNSNPVQSLVHFLSVFVLGMFCCHFREKLFTALKGKSWMLIVLCSVLVTLDTYKISDSVKLNVLYKSVLCVFLLYCLWKADKEAPKFFHRSLSLFAEYSFGIYFLHDYFLFACWGIEKRLHWSIFSKTENPFSFFLLFSFTLVGCIALIAGIRKVFGKNSRLVVGC